MALLILLLTEKTGNFKKCEKSADEREMLMAMLIYLSNSEESLQKKIREVGGRKRNADGIAQFEAGRRLLRPG